MKSQTQEYHNINNLLFSKSTRITGQNFVKAIVLIMNLLVFNSSIAQNEHNKAEQLYYKCRNLTIQMAQNNDTSVSEELTDSLVSLAMTDAGYVNQYNDWYKNYLENLKKGITENLTNLEALKQEATKARQDSFNTMLKNVNENVQNKSVEIQNKSLTKKAARSVYRCDDCPAGTIR